MLCLNQKANIDTLSTFIFTPTPHTNPVNIKVEGLAVRPAAWEADIWAWIADGQFSEPLQTLFGWAERWMFTTNSDKLCGLSSSLCPCWLR